MFRYGMWLVLACCLWFLGTQAGMLRTGTVGRLRFIYRHVGDRNLMANFINRYRAIVQGEEPWPDFCYRSTLAIVPGPPDPALAISYNLIVLGNTAKGAALRRLAFFVLLGVAGWLAHWFLIPIGIAAYAFGGWSETRCRGHGLHLNHIEEMGTVELLSILVLLLAWKEEAPGSGLIRVKKTRNDTGLD